MNGNYFEYIAQELRRVEHVAGRYASSRMSFVENFCVRLLLSALERFSVRDSGSEELLCFGCHVTAVKR
jgi:hypothetical protein